MAGLNHSTDNLAPHASWSPAQTRAQFTAIAILRWRITVNAFRRKGGAGDLVARIITYPIFACLALLPTVGAGIGAFYFTSNGELQHLDWLLWATFVLCQLLNIQLGQPGTTFDPTQLIRFPMRTRIYVAIRLFFGLLTPANVVGTLMVCAMVVGVGIAAPALTGYALLALLAFAAVNVLFSRMLFAWVDRWLSTRRAREVLTALIFAVSLGFQYLNVAFNPAYSHHHHVSAARLNAGLSFYHHIHPILAALPPDLAGSALVAASQGRATAYLLGVAGIALYALVFFAVFALRMRTEFRGENLSDVANAVAATPKRIPRIPRPSGLAPNAGDHALAQPARGAFGLPPQFATILGKELLYVRRNTGLFYGLIAPIVMVFLFAGKLASRSNAAWIFPAAIAYSLMGVAPMSYNSFGLEGTGSQFYFLAPVRLRDVFLAKNLMNFLLAFIEVAAVFAIITYVAAMPSPLAIANGFLWAAGTLLFSTTLGNRRSVTAPKKIDLGRTASKQASPLSALISLGILIGSAGLGCLLLLAGSYFDKAWLPLPILLAFAAAALLVYTRGLTTIDRYTLDHRDEMFEELCKK